MAFNTKIKIDNGHVIQDVGTTLGLSGHTVIGTTADMKYAVHPTFTGNTQVVDKKYVDDQVISATGQSIYNLQTPATVTVGGITPGTQLTGKSSNCLLKEILTPYQAPSFSSFSNNVSTPVEVGCQIGGSKSFSWIFTQGANVCPLAFCIRDVTLGSNIATNISSASPAGSVTITNKTFTSCGDSQVWCGCAKNTCGTMFGSGSHTVTALLPYYYGKCTCPGPAGANRPTLTSSMITGGTKELVSSSGSISIPFGSGADDYLWFAIPATVANKVCWYVDAINNGGIGGGIGAGCCLFPTPGATVAVTTACWTGCQYCVYVSNKQTANTSMSIS